MTDSEDASECWKRIDNALTIVGSECFKPTK